MRPVNNTHIPAPIPHLPCNSQTDRLVET